MLEYLVRDNIKRMNAYSSARDEFKQKAEIYLDANENPFENGLNRYPDPYQMEVKKEISKWREIAVENIVLGNGSDEILDLIFRVFCEPRIDNVLLLPPTYGMYKVLANTNDVATKEIGLKKDFSLDVDAI